ncbi:MAG: Wzz/FepE/Etk N-terminal domain-containing protein, partial [Desulfosalsimonas sp.]
MNEEKRNSIAEGGRDYYDDEISLIDLWMVLMKRKKVIFAVTLLCILGGFAFWLTRSPQERYITSIEIGRYLNENRELERIETRESIDTRLRNSIMPSLRNEVAEKFELPLEQLPKVNVRVPEKEGTGDFVFLETTTTPEKKEIVDALHKGSFERLEKIHSDMLNIRKQRFSVRKSIMEMDLEELKDETRLRLLQASKKTELEKAENKLEERKEVFPIEHQERKHELELHKDGLEAAKDEFKTEEQNLEHSIRRTEDKIKQLSQEKERLQDRLKRVSVEEELFKGEIEDLENWMKNARDSQQDLYGTVHNDA